MSVHGASVMSESPDKKIITHNNNKTENSNTSIKGAESIL